MADIIKRTKGWFVGAGILLILTGTAAIALPLAFAIALEVLLGWLLVICGLVQIVHSFKALDTGRCIIRFVGGLVYLGIGIIFLVYPLRGVITLTLLLAVLFLFEGLLKIVISIQHRDERNWGWLLASGIAGILIAAIIWAGWPETAAWVIGLLVGINLIFGGWSLIMVSASLNEV